MFGYWPVVEVNTGIDELHYINGIKFTMAPNPAKNNVKFRYSIEDNSNSVNLAIYDLTGRVVYENTETNVASNTTNTMTVDISSLPAGNYYASLTANGKRMTQKLVVTK